MKTRRSFHCRNCMLVLFVLVLFSYTTTVHAKGGGRGGGRGGRGGGRRGRHPTYKRAYRHQDSLLATLLWYGWNPLGFANVPRVGESLQVLLSSPYDRRPVYATGTVVRVDDASFIVEYDNRERRRKERRSIRKERQVVWLVGLVVLGIVWLEHRKRQRNARCYEQFVQLEQVVRPALLLLKDEALLPQIKSEEEATSSHHHAQMTSTSSDGAAVLTTTTTTLATNNASTIRSGRYTGRTHESDGTKQSVDVTLKFEHRDDQNIGVLRGWGHDGKDGDYRLVGQYNIAVLPKGDDKSDNNNTNDPTLVVTWTEQYYDEYDDATYKNLTDPGFETTVYGQSRDGGQTLECAFCSSRNIHGVVTLKRVGDELDQQPYFFDEYQVPPRLVPPPAAGQKKKDDEDDDGVHKNDDAHHQQQQQQYDSHGLARRRVRDVVSTRN